MDDVIEHYGVKGMKWGVRKERKPERITTTHQPGKRVKAQGGRYANASKDAVRSAKLKQKAKKSSVDSLSNQELQALVTRMNLEKQYANLSPKSPREQAGKFFAEAIMGSAKNQARQQIDAQVNDYVKTKMK